MRDSITIFNEIKNLLDELEGSLGVKTTHDRASSKAKTNDLVPKGALGAINMLIHEDFFDTPKGISVIMEKLKEIGHYHKATTISMNLLNLTKRRTLNRFKNKKTKNWEYVIRK